MIRFPAEFQGSNQVACESLGRSGWAGSPGAAVARSGGIARGDGIARRKQPTLHGRPLCFAVACVALASSIALVALRTLPACWSGASPNACCCTAARNLVPAPAVGEGGLGPGSACPADHAERPFDAPCDPDHCAFCFLLCGGGSSLAVVSGGLALPCVGPEGLAVGEPLDEPASIASTSIYRPPRA